MRTQRAAALFVITLLLLGISHRTGAAVGDDCSNDATSCDGSNSEVCSAGTCSCNAGYIDNAGTCTGQCPLANIPAVTNGGHDKTAAMTEGDVATYTCDTGYGLQDPTTNTQICVYGATFVDTLQLPVCIEQDECELATDNCADNATCINTIGSFTCTCNAGYGGNGVICTGECPFVNIPVVTNGGHDQTTTMAEGGVAIYTCSPGYGLRNAESNKQTCVTGTTFTGELPVCRELNECEGQPSVCDSNANCVDTVGSYTCTCNPGYTGNGRVCTGECPFANIPVVANGAHDQTTAMAGEGVAIYTCNAGYGLQNAANNKQTCVTGTTFDGDLPVCVELNECQNQPPVCASSATCANTAGSYTCTCNDGYTGDGVVCTGECPLASIPTVANGRHDQTAAMSEGGVATYSCNAGYTLAANSANTQTCVRGTTFQGTLPACVDINECQQDNACNNNAVCSNNAGSFTCTCPSGYKSGGIVTTAGRVAISMFVRLDVTVAASVTDITTHYKDELGETIESFYNNEFTNNEFTNCATIHVGITSISAGSLRVNYIISFPDDPNTHARIARINSDLANDALVVFSESADVQELVASGVDVPVGSSAVNDVILCAMYEASIEGCPNTEECVMENSLPTCQPIETSSNLGLILGLTIGIPGFLMITLLILVVVFNSSKNHRRKKQRPFQRQFPRRSRIGRIESPVRIHRPRVSRVPSFASSADSEMGYDEDFSWEFLSNHLNPYQKYEIQRPKVSPRAARF